MNRKISICIIVFGIVLTTVAFLGTSRTQTLPQETQEEEFEVQDAGTETQQTVAVSVEENPNYKFILRERDGRLVVCKPGNTGIYMETGILVEELPEPVRARLSNGIGFVSEELLFDFLESYSS